MTIGEFTSIAHRSIVRRSLQRRRPGSSACTKGTPTAPSRCWCVITRRRRHGLPRLVVFYVLHYPHRALTLTFRSSRRSVSAPRVFLKMRNAPTSTWSAVTVPQKRVLNQSRLLIRNARLVNEGQGISWTLMYSRQRLYREIASSLEDCTRPWRSTQRANGCRWG